MRVLYKKKKEPVKGLTSERTWRAIYRLLDRVSPVDYDCGELCGAACCTCGSNTIIDDEERDMRIYLYPNEHLIHEVDGDDFHWTAEEAEDYEFPESWEGLVYFVNCKTPPVCKRGIRPLQCRTFPLKPYINEDGFFELVWNNDELPYECPLIEKEMVINEDFYRATYTVWAHLLRDPLIYDLVEMESAEFEFEEE